MRTTTPLSGKQPIQIEIDFNEIHDKNAMNTDGKLEVAEIEVNLPDGRYVKFFVDVVSEGHNIKCQVANNGTHKTATKSLTGKKANRR